MVVLRFSSEHYMYVELGETSKFEEYGGEVSFPASSQTSILALACVSDLPLPRAKFVQVNKNPLVSGRLFARVGFRGMYIREDVRQRKHMPRMFAYLRLKA